jgi:hypothetical protein
MVYINTLMIQNVLGEPEWADALSGAALPAASS